MNLNIWSLMGLLGYATLLSPPEARHIHHRHHSAGGELERQPLWMVALIEYMVRGALLVVLAWGIQELLGYVNFRRFGVHWFVVALGLCGSLHTLAYYACGPKDNNHPPNLRSPKCYRLIRNLALSILPAAAVSGLALIWQETHNIPLFKGDLVQNAFLLAWATVAVLSILEALLMRRIPSGLNKRNAAWQ